MHNSIAQESYPTLECGDRHPKLHKVYLLYIETKAENFMHKHELYDNSFCMQLYCFCILSGMSLQSIARFLNTSERQIKDASVGKITLRSNHVFMVLQLMETSQKNNLAHIMERLQPHITLQTSADPRERPFGDKP